MMMLQNKENVLSIAIKIFLQTRNPHLFSVQNIILRPLLTIPPSIPVQKHKILMESYKSSSSLKIPPVEATPIHATPPSMKAQFALD
jgi:hypothetical protein